jgi:hypothetical protein
MRDHRPKSANDLIGTSKLSAIQQHASEIASINHQLAPLLPKGTASFVRVANIRHGYLILEAASAAIKMKLDHERLHILSMLRQQGCARLVGIDVIINPSIYRNKHQENEDVKIKKREISPFAAEILNMVAANASPKIKQRLENIAKLANTEKTDK